MNRLKNKLENYQRALDALKTGAAQIKNLNDLEKDGLIQRFEFTFELAWKLLKDYLISDGMIEPGGPRSTIKAAAQIGLIDPFSWEEMLEARNTLSHQYDEAKSRDVVYQIANVFINYFDQLSEDLNERTKS
jgi:nucleotidyltransferase substrate binding protein (TIGR01987 family)